MIRRLPYILVLLTSSVAFAHEGEVGLDLSRSSGDADNNVRSFYAIGHLPLKKNIQGEIGAEMTNTNVDGAPDSDSSRISFGIYGINDKATFGVRVNSFSDTVKTAVSKTEVNSTRIDFDASVSLTGGQLANVGLSRISGGASDATALHGGLDFFPAPDNMVSVEMSTTPDLNNYGVQYLLMPKSTLGVSAKFVHSRFDDSGFKQKSNIISLNVHYYFDENGSKNKISRLKSRKAFWQSILR